MALDKLSKFFGISEEEDASENEDFVADTSLREPVLDNKPMKRGHNVVSIDSGLKPTSKIVIYEPRVYSDAKEVAQNLLNNKATIINFSRMDDASARRVVDFITGTVYALSGEIQRVGDKIFLATPPKFETDGKVSELVGKKDNLD